MMNVFTGKEHDSESGLDYFGARYYGSTMGRFMSPDSGGDATVGVPVPFADLGNPQSLNLYSYVLNNPVRSVDPDGHDVRICASGSSQCYNVTDGQSKAIQQQIAAGNGGGVTVSGNGFMGTGTNELNNGIPDAKIADFAARLYMAGKVSESWLDRLEEQGDSVCPCEGFEPGKTGKRTKNWPSSEGLLLIAKVPQKLQGIAGRAVIAFPA